MIKIIIFALVTILSMTLAKYLIQRIEKKQEQQMFPDNNWIEGDSTTMEVHYPSDDLIIEDSGTCNWLSRTPDFTDTIKFNSDKEKS